MSNLDLTQKKTYLGAKRNTKIPHLVQYQGSKRSLALQILNYLPTKFERLVEPFAGSAALSIACAFHNRTDSFWLNDLNAPLINLLREAIEDPDSLVESYAKLWSEHFSFQGSHLEHYYRVRESFNLGDQDPANMLYLLARCVKGAVRYNKNGNFSQSPDKRRHGLKPQNLATNTFEISKLLKGKVKFSSVDFKEVLKEVKRGDVVYLDPPYQGVSHTRDPRYIEGVLFEDLVLSLDVLNRKGIAYLLSYDGQSGTQAYGKDLPKDLHLKKIFLKAGLSSQATLLGKKQETKEALYLSPSLYCFMQRNSRCSLMDIDSFRICRNLSKEGLSLS